MRAAFCMFINPLEVVYPLRIVNLLNAPGSIYLNPPKSIYTNQPGGINPNPGSSSNTISESASINSICFEQTTKL